MLNGVMGGDSFGGNWVMVRSLVTFSGKVANIERWAVLSSMMCVLPLGNILRVIMLFVLLSYDQAAYCADEVNRHCMSGYAV